jgi:hypothetical protein
VVQAKRETATSAARYDTQSRPGVLISRFAASIPYP